MPDGFSGAADVADRIPGAAYVPAVGSEAAQDYNGCKAKSDCASAAATPRQVADLVVRAKAALALASRVAAAKEAAEAAKRTGGRAAARRAAKAKAAYMHAVVVAEPRIAAVGVRASSELVL